MSKFNISKLLKVLTYVNEVMKFLFPFLQKVEEEKKDKNSSNVEPKNN